MDSWELLHCRYKLPQVWGQQNWKETEMQGEKVSYKFGWDIQGNIIFRLLFQGTDMQTEKNLSAVEPAISTVL